MNIDRFRQDHVAILTEVTELRKLIQTGISQNAGTIAKKIVAISSTIKLHLAAEDRTLYPRLLASDNPDVAQLGIIFQAEMGDIAAAYMEFARRWNLESKVSADPDGFKEDANNIFKSLHQRIQRENKKLYPLAEHL
ncbi:MAG: hemerythrin domain-containing protein [Methylobacter sp.]|jgi:hemerythrin-like domain-containing protein|nr:hemerythrin domain-containing protein [Methylobacter sp.]